MERREFLQLLGFSTAGVALLGPRSLEPLPPQIVEQCLLDLSYADVSVRIEVPEIEFGEGPFGTVNYIPGPARLYVDTKRLHREHYEVALNALTRQKLVRIHIQNRGWTFECDAHVQSIHYSDLREFICDADFVGTGEPSIRRTA